ncbi:Transcription factor bHLH52 [Carex littledalei]|uniref:Transcription factor bHLH52 n=1 Tax=Carex littledalei TaxID=544730 RepID=A0A833VN19_9POAL|nr:Transcription factor bHLH52 [Carex littledalei]
MGLICDPLEAPECDIGALLNSVPMTRQNEEPKASPVLLELTDSLMGLICDPLEAPESDIAALLNSVPITCQNKEPKTSPVLVELTDSLMGPICDPLEAPESDIAALLNSVPMTRQNEEPKASPVLVELTDSLMGPICDPLEAPESDIAALLNSVPMTCHNEEPKASPVPTLNSSLTSPSIHSLHQDPYHTNAQNSYPANAKYAPNPFPNHYLTCNNDFSTTSSTDPVDFLNQNPGFPVGPFCIGTTQGMVVPAVKSVSAQNVAARARRKKISGKTQELVKLIPGGTRMTTNEMLLAAYKYVKFLEAQTSILAMMDSKEGYIQYVACHRQIQYEHSSPTKLRHWI